MEKMLKFGLLAGGLYFGIKLLDTILNEQNKIRNYRLFSNDKLVYHGITHNNRKKLRIFEHKKLGKIFDKVKFDKQQSEEDAWRIEAKRIKRDKPIYNIQNNINKSKN